MPQPTTTTAMPEIFVGDLPAGLDLGSSVAIDTETLGLNLNRDRLCLVQLCTADGRVYFVQFKPGQRYNAPNLSALLADPTILKIFHFGRFDIAIMAIYTGGMAQNVFCTKIASKLCRTYTERHGLKDLCKDLLGVELNKQQQTTDWGGDALTGEQLAYAANDVIYLHALKEKLEALLIRDGRFELANACFEFLPARAALDMAGWDEKDIFAHSDKKGD